jgi:hypothetical protein
LKKQEATNNMENGNHGIGRLALELRGKPGEDYFVCDARLPADGKNGALQSSDPLHARIVVRIAHFGRNRAKVTIEACKECVKIVRGKLAQGRDVA